jgi:selenocysteine lyase/cysteine desulfurase
MAARIEADQIGCERSLFDIPPHIVYLNCATMAPQLRAATAAGLAAVSANASPWLRTAADWFSGPERLRGLVARLMNAEAECVALIPSVSYGIAVAAANLPIERGQTIVVLDAQFPSNVYAWRALAERRSAQVRAVRRSPGDGWTPAVLEAIDASTAILALPNCHWADGGLLALPQIAEAARSVGAALVVDATQSLGAYPLDVPTLRPDFVVAAGYKWLLGPYSLGYLYAAPRWHHGVPLEQSWLARAGSEDFSRLTRYTDELRAGARRFDMGECSQFTTLPIATAALEQIDTWGVARIQRSLTPLTRRVCEGLAELGGSALPERHRVGHLIGIRMPAEVIQRAARALAAARVFVSIRGDYIRIAPHLYNDESDIDRLVDCLRELE